MARVRLSIVARGTSYCGRHLLRLLMDPRAAAANLRAMRFPVGGRLLDGVEVRDGGEAGSLIVLDHSDVGTGGVMGGELLRGRVVHI